MTEHKTSGSSRTSVLLLVLLLAVAAASSLYLTYPSMPQVVKVTEVSSSTSVYEYTSFLTPAVTSTNSTCFVRAEEEQCRYGTMTFQSGVAQENSYYIWNTEGYSSTANQTYLVPPYGSMGNQVQVVVVVAEFVAFCVPALLIVRLRQSSVVPRKIRGQAAKPTKKRDWDRTLRFLSIIFGLQVVGVLLDLLRRREQSLISYGEACVPYYGCFSLINWDVVAIVQEMLLVEVALGAAVIMLVVYWDASNQGESTKEAAGWAIAAGLVVIIVVPIYVIARLTHNVGAECPSCHKRTQSRFAKLCKHCGSNLNKAVKVQ